MAFGDVINEMLECLNDICMTRALRSEDDDKDPTSSWVDASRLSERNAAILRGDIDIPEVKGIRHHKSIPKVARERARQLDAEFKEWVRLHAGVADSQQLRTQHLSFKKAVDDQWDYALTISFASGFAFNDRSGC